MERMDHSGWYNFISSILYLNTFVYLLFFWLKCIFLPLSFKNLQFWPPKFRNYNFGPLRFSLIANLIILANFDGQCLRGTPRM